MENRRWGVDRNLVYPAKNTRGGIEEEPAEDDVKIYQMSRRREAMDDRGGYDEVRRDEKYDEDDERYDEDDYDDGEYDEEDKRRGRGVRIPEFLRRRGRSEKREVGRTKEASRSQKKSFGGKMAGLVSKMIGEKREALPVRDCWAATRNKNELDPNLDPDRVNEDAMLLVPEMGLFGVFDGAGGEIGAARASDDAKRAVERLAEKIDSTSEWGMKQILENANRIVTGDEKAGMTTATVARVWEDEETGEKKLTFASVGDSRIYLFRGGKMRLLSEDEGYLNFITNALGLEECEVKQVRTITVKEGDRFMICSDGVTGDTPEQAPKQEDMIKIAREARTMKEMAEGMLGVALKPDDQTVVCFE